MSRPNKSSDDATEIFDAHTRESLGLIGSTEDMIEIDFADGKASRVGDQYRVARRAQFDELIDAGYRPGDPRGCNPSSDVAQRRMEQE
jgi:hypothetical protein